MIPTFPVFKAIELHDKKDIAALLPSKPYSDYNFTNLWCWDTDDKRRVSMLNGNLVVLFTDYITRKPFLSFCGTKKPVSTAKELLMYAHEKGMESVLHYIPHSTARLLTSKKLILKQDEGNFDYIFSSSQIAEAKGSQYKKKRQLANKFIAKYPHAEFTIEKTLTEQHKKDIHNTMLRWHRKKKKFSESQFRHEKAALQRLLTHNKNHSVLLSAVYVGKTMIAFSIDEMLTKKYAISHFLKGDNSYIGVYEYLNQKTAAYLTTQGVEYWNWEQDLNIEGLRALKMSYRPISFLKKHTVSLQNKS